MSKEVSMNNLSDLVWVTVTDLLPLGTEFTISHMERSITVIIAEKSYIFTKTELMSKSNTAKSFIALLKSKLNL